MQTTGTVTWPQPEGGNGGALASDPKLLLLDEVSMGLAPVIVEQLLRVIKTLASQGVTTVLVEQLVDDALDIADYVVLLGRGTVAAVGQPADIRPLLVSSYLGSDTVVGGIAERAPSTAALPALVQTSEGTLAHDSSCPVLLTRQNLRPATKDLTLCGLCH